MLVRRPACSSPPRPRLAAILLVFLLCCLGAPAAASAQAAITVEVVGAGTVDLEVPGGSPASCPSPPPLANPDSGEPVRCTVGVAPTCTPAGTATSCQASVKATAVVPGTPWLTTEEVAQNGWVFREWTAGPCANGRATPCTVPVGTCTATGCAYEPRTLAASFDDRRAPVARFVTTPLDDSQDPTGRAAFTFRSDEYEIGEVSRFECRLDGSDAWPACAGPDGAHTLTVAGGSHVLQVRAVDPSGNVQGRSIPLFRWNQPPRLVDPNIVHGAFTSKDAVDFAIDFKDAGARFTCRLDEGEAAPCAGSFAARDLADGPHALTVAATWSTAAGPQTATARTTWTVDTVAPETVILSGPDDRARTPSRTATFTFRPEPAGDAVAGFRCRLDDLESTPCDPSGITYTDIAPGDHEFTVTATDAAGNVEAAGASRDWTVIVDNDGDGSFEDDCDDANPAVKPGAPDPAGDGADQDCDGFDGAGFGSDFGGFGTDNDLDGDPVPPEGGDCDDSDPMANSFGEEVPENGVDEDCDGEDALKRGIGLRLRADWRVNARSSRLVRLVATKVPARTVLRITCRKGCPVALKQIPVRRARKELNLLSYLGGPQRLPAGAVLEVRATKGGRSPEGRRWRVRRGRPPVTAAFCIHAKKREPGRC